MVLESARPAVGLFDPLELRCGPTWSNRLALAPMTNTQSYPDGRLSDEEFEWLRARAAGGFGLVMTCAAHVQATGQGFPGQLGVFADEHLPGLTRLASAIGAAGSVSSVQLHHAGVRADPAIVTDPVGPSDNERSGARAMTIGEVEQVIADFAAAAGRAESAGFDGVEIHGAHGYLITQFLSTQYNQRTDRYGGPIENRARLLLEIIDAIRDRCGPQFQLGVRISPERFGIVLGEARELCAQLLTSGRLDYVDLSLWDAAKEPADESLQGRSLLSWFTDLDRAGTRLGVAGLIRTARRSRELLAEGADFVFIGRAAILHHDFPNRVAGDTDFEPVPFPVTREYLATQAVSPVFVDYIRDGWSYFVEADA